MVLISNSSNSLLYTSVDKEYLKSFTELTKRLVNDKSLNEKEKHFLIGEFQILLSFIIIK